MNIVTKDAMGQRPNDQDTSTNINKIWLTPSNIDARFEAMNKSEPNF